MKKSLPLSSTTMKAGKSSTSIFQTASMPGDGGCAPHEGLAPTHEQDESDEDEDDIEQVHGGQGRVMDMTSRAASRSASVISPRSTYPSSMTTSRIVLRSATDFFAIAAAFS